MGVTIHYNGKLDDRARLAELLDAARLYCAEQRWAYRDVDERILGKVERVVDSNSTREEIAGVQVSTVSADDAETELTPIDDFLTGIVISPHPNSEPLWLTFNHVGELANYLPLDDLGTYWEIKSLFVKTQFAGMDTHIAVCDLLHLLQSEYMPGLNVYDESNYFESGDALRAEDSMEGVEQALDQLQRTLEGLDENDPRADYIRQVIESTQNEQSKKKIPSGKKLNIERGKKISHPNPRWKRGHGSSAGKN